MLREPHVEISGVPKVMAGVPVGPLEMEQILGRRCGYADRLGGTPVRHGDRGAASA
jgi:hypothetical protein